MTKKLRLKNSPLVLVLAQVRFSPILKMQDYVAGIQERLRRQGYPLFEEEQRTVVAVSGEAQIRQTATPGVRWIFSSPRRDASVVLTHDFIVLETNNYDVFEVFSEKLLTILQLLKEETGVACVQRVGLRYVDLIRPIGGKAARTFLQESFRGFSVADFDGLTTLENASVAYGTTSLGGKLVVRVVESSDGQCLPPDLQETRLHFSSDGKPNQGELVTILDIDHYAQLELDFEPEKVIDQANALHEMTDKAFRTVVTAEALEIWRG